MKHIEFTLALRVGLCCAWMAAIATPQVGRAQARVETAPEADSPTLHEVRFAGGAALSPPDSIDPAAHTLARYDLGDVERIAREYRVAGMPWFYERHTPELMRPFLDSTNVPIREYDFGWHRNPVLTSQAALAFYTGYLETGSPEYLEIFQANVDWLLENHDEYYLRYDFSWQHAGRPLPTGWVSGMAQGEALAAVSAAYHLTGEQKYLEAADGFFRTLHRNTEDSWTFTVDEEHHYWLEEYPNVDTCHVLNGILFGLWGLWSYYVVSENGFALELFEAGIQSVASHYPIWNMEDLDLSLYCRHGLWYTFYHETHLRQLRDYLRYFDIPEFEEAIELFQLHPAISGSLTEVNFGPVEIGSKEERVVTIVNSGTDTLAIERTVIDPPVFRAPDDSTLVPPGDSLQLLIEFEPNATGTVTAVLSIIGNAPLFRIRLLGIGVIEGLATGDEEIARGFALDQNYPNPFSASTTLRYRLSDQAHVRIAVVNALGQEVRVLADRRQAPGAYELRLERGGLPAGVYFCRFEAGALTQTQKLVIR